MTTLLICLLMAVALVSAAILPILAPQQEELVLIPVRIDDNERGI